VQETVAVALHAGTDLETGSSFYAQHAQEALDNKTIVEIKQLNVLSVFSFDSAGSIHLNNNSIVV
jgi:hypothetical protein